jgi:hypothetical protein
MYLRERTSGGHTKRLQIVDCLEIDNLSIAIQGGEGIAWVGV